MVTKYYIPKENKSRPIIMRKFIYSSDIDSTKVQRPTLSRNNDFSFTGKPSKQYNLSNYNLVSKSTYLKYNKSKVNSLLK